jgi:hypothetical protein
MPIFRREFPLAGHVAKATLRISGLGQFEAHINGRKVTQALMTPGWTDYRKRVFFDQYDVTSLLHPGANAIGVMLGNGMYNVVETKGRYTKFEGSFGSPKLIAQLDVTFAGGSSATIASDPQWTIAAGPITYSSTYGGEDYDARLEQKGWDQPYFHAPFSGPDWRPALPVDGPGGALVSEKIPPVMALAEFRPIRVTHPEAGVAVYDLGRNFSGWPEIAVRGERGVALKLICGELLDAHGRVTQRSAGADPGSQNEFNYVLRGGGIERWSPRFSYYGFRYVEVRTSPGHRVAILHVSGQFLHDAVHVDGSFRSSERLFNRIHALIDAAMLSNMVSVLTDCPHREKLGWLEQTHLAGPSLMYNFHLAELYDKMAADMRDSQLPGGLVPSIAPEYPVFDGGFRDSPEWGAAVVLSPWTAYRFYGDVEALRAQYAAMKSYMAYLHGRLQNGLLTYGLGDWYDIGPGEPGESKLTSKGVTATYYESLTAMRRIALLLNQPEDARGFAEEADRVKAAFNAAYFHPETGTYDRGSQTANAMPLVVGLVPEDRRGGVLAGLVQDIRAHGNHVTAGDIGFHYVVRALTDGGRSDVLYDMLSRTDKPSYGDQLAHGATTLTEAWDANPNSSQNHFMLGHAEEWFYRGLAGIDVDMSRKAAEQIRISPAVVGDLRWARASYQSALGRIESRWSRTGQVLRLAVSIPRGTTATIALPEADKPRVVAGGTHYFRVVMRTPREKPD